MTYELLPHTADVRAVLRAPDRRSLLQVAIDLVREITVGDSPVEPSTSRVIEAGADSGAGAHDEAEGFFRFVRELVYLCDLEGFLPATVVETDPATVAGEVFAESRHAIEHHVKALTRHGYRFEHGPGGYTVEMVFDL